MLFLLHISPCITFAYAGNYWLVITYTMKFWSLLYMTILQVYIFSLNETTDFDF